MTNSVFFPIPCWVVAITSRDGFMFIKLRVAYLELTWYPETAHVMTTCSNKQVSALATLNDQILCDA